MSIPYAGNELELFAEAVRWKRYWAAHVRHLFQGSVLEVGAGLGANTRVLCGPRVSSWLCLEPDAGMRERLSSAHAAGQLPQACSVDGGTVQSLVSAGRFDAIIYADVLEHIEDDRRELAKASELLVRGGWLIVLAPAFEWLYSPFDKAIGHYRRYNKRSLTEAAPATLELAFSRYLDAAGVLASLANKILLGQKLPTPQQIGLWDRYMVPISRVLDPMLQHSFGRSVLVVWRRP